MDTELVHEFLSCMDRLNRMREQHEIQKQLMGEMFVLRFLHQHGQTTPGNLSKALQVSTARTAAILNNLEKKGFITRTASSIDRRKSDICITQHGIAILEHGLAMIEQRVAKILEALGEKDSRELIRILNRMIVIQTEFHPYCNPKEHTVSPDRKD